MTALETRYTTRLQAGLGMLAETRALLELWQPGMAAPALAQAALDSGRFPDMSARRLHNLVTECFAPRYLVQRGQPARLLKALGAALAPREAEQLMFLCTCRATPVLADFVRGVYWPAYAAGRTCLEFDDALGFVTRANQQGQTASPWSAGTLRRVAGYLNGCCADFGLLERGVRPRRRLLPFHLEPRVAAILAYDLHLAGQGDNRLLASPDWTWFGLTPEDALAILKRLALGGALIVQAAGGAAQIGWRYKTIDEVIDAVAHGAL